ncbi:DUF1449 family protein [bacterium]|jgi:hypothetical protein|nr:DUF1449 family protein [bacterium]
MIEFIGAGANLPFAVALLVMVGISLLEGFAMIVGFGFSSLLDDFLPDLGIDVDVDLDMDADLDGIDAGGYSGFHKFFAWLCPGKVPSIILLVVFLTTFGLLGLGLQLLAKVGLGTMVSAYIMGPAVFFLTFPVLKPINQLIIPLIPQDETEAVSHRSFIGLPANITLGKAEPGKPAEAKLVDKNGKTHYLMVEPENDGDVLQAGESIVIVEGSGSKFIAVSTMGSIEQKERKLLDQKNKNESEIEPKSGI